MPAKARVASGTRTRIMLASLGKACTPGMSRSAACSRCALGHAAAPPGARTRRHAPARTARPRQFSTLTLYGGRTLSICVDQIGRAAQVAQAHAGQAELAKRAHHQHMLVRGHARHPGARRERLVGLVEDDQAVLRADRGDDALDDRVVEQVGGRVVRVGDVGQRRAVRLDRRQHRRFVELEVAASAARRRSCRPRSRADISYITKPGSGASTVAPGTSQATDSSVDQLVRAVAQHQRCSPPAARHGAPALRPGRPGAAAG